jgi:hypothetical protein
LHAALRPGHASDAQSPYAVSSIGIITIQGILRFEAWPCAPDAVQHGAQRRDAPLIRGPG